MAQVELILPKMGESITEATILKWLKKEGDYVDVDESVVEIATDKVDSDVPSITAGTITKLLYKEGDVVEVGKPIVILDTEFIEQTKSKSSEPQQSVATQPESEFKPVSKAADGRFYSPLVMNIARNESISMTELETIPGTGKNERVTKKDILGYLENKDPQTQTENISLHPTTTIDSPAQPTQPQQQATPTVSGNVEILEMDRMRKLIAEHMVMSKSTSAHVTSFVEADVTNLVLWRNKIKDDFALREGEKITFTPLFIEAVIKALKDFPIVNGSIDGDKIIIKKDLNIGMATALPNGNLIVPVIKNADQLNLVGLTKRVNALANSARNNKLTPMDVDGGTFTLSNVGTFGNLMGTPIINQPQLAIMATGAIKKKPVVLETEAGDVIAIRHMMFLSLSYDHRVVDGFMGGSFLRKVADNLEAFDSMREL